MATVDSKGRVHGKIGPVIYRMFRGTQVAQSRCKPFPQTRASKESACEFGLASTSAKTIRDAFTPIHNNRHDKGVVNRLNALVYRAIRASVKPRGERDIHDADLDLLQGFEFNLKSKFSDTVQVRPGVSLNEKGQVFVSVPEIDVKRDLRPCNFARTHEGGYYQIKFVLIGFNLRQGFYEYIGVKELLITKASQRKTRPCQLVFEGEVPKGCFLMLGVSFAFLWENMAEGRLENMNAEGFSPAMVLAAFPPRDEAEEGYGDNRISLDSDAASQAEVMKTMPATSYRGRDLLKRIRELRAKKNPDKPSDERLAPATYIRDDNAGLEGKRVKI